MGVGVAVGELGWVVGAVESGSVGLGVALGPDGSSEDGGSCVGVGEGSDVDSSQSATSPFSVFETVTEKGLGSSGYSVCSMSSASVFSGA